MLIFNSYQIESLNLLPIEQTSSSLILSTNFSSLQEISYSASHQFENYATFISSLSF
jgi:hypothetical protein